MTEKNMNQPRCIETNIIDNANDLIVVLDSGGKVQLWNKAAESLTGYSRSEVTGSRNVWKLLYPDADYRGMITKRITDIIAKNKYFENIETTIVTKAGGKRMISWNTRQIEEDGEVMAIAIGRDITEIVKAKWEIKRNAAFQESIIINARLLIAFIDTGSKVVIWNKAAEEITGYSRDKVVGHDTVWKWLYPDDKYRKEVTKKIIDIIRNKRYLENFETFIRTNDGNVRRISWNTRELTEEDSEQLGYIIIGNDITEQRMADAFRESIINNANVIIIVLDAHGKVLVWNKAAESITGYPADEVIGSPNVWKRLYPDPDYRRMITKRITDIIAKNKYFENLETVIATRSGELRVISWNTRQIGEGGNYQAIAIGQDVTERKQAEEALLAYMAEMAMRIKQPVEIIRDNLSDVAHLIRKGKVTFDDIAILLEGQVRNATQVAANVQMFQKEIVERNREIPEAYRKFLQGD